MNEFTISNCKDAGSVNMWISSISEADMAHGIEDMRHLNNPPSISKVIDVYPEKESFYLKYYTLNYVTG